MDEKKKPSRKKPSSGLAWVAILFLIGLLRRLDLGSLTRRVAWMLRRGQFMFDESMILPLVMVTLAVIVILAVIIRAARNAAARRNDPVASPRRSAGEAHSHDRLAGYRMGSENADEHWKRQLDSFLEAGLIDRAEYRVLLERRRSDSNRNI